VKGEAEEAVKQAGPKDVGIFRPAMIRGSQHTPGALALVAPLFDLVIPGKYHSITTKQIAAAMVGASLRRSAGTFSYPEMIELGRAKGSGT